MGDGTWSTKVYSAAKATRTASGLSDFHYSDSGNRTVHATLNPLNVTRESRDSDEHPQSLAIAVLLDVTGSMRDVPRQLQAKLPALLGLLLRKGYVTHPQILFGGIGDATTDRVPLQLSQFESDNRLDEHLRNLVLEGGGGGQMTESYELALYFMARHTQLDCWEKRGRRGYLFIVGDEMAYPRVDPSQVHKHIGDLPLNAVSISDIVMEAKRLYDIYYILPAGSSYAGNTEVLGFWRGLLGQNVIELDDLEAACETIALMVGLGEQAIDLATGVADLSDVGSTAGATVSKALAPLAAARGSVVVSPAPRGLAIVDDGTEGVTRL